MIKSVQDSAQLSRLVIKGYKSISVFEMPLAKLNILIGANGAGKSNFIAFFKLIKRIFDEKLQLTVAESGGPDALLYYGRKRTDEMSAELYFGNNGYRFSLRPTADNRMVFAREALWWNVSGDYYPRAGHFETYAHEQKMYTNIYNFVVPTIGKWRVYHFHDTGSSALVKQVHNINDNIYLREDARNLAAFLYMLRDLYQDSYNRIIKTIRLVAPFFGNFLLRPTTGNAEKIQLEWMEAGEDMPFSASALSDGTLRFICLATVLLQPEELAPATILIDEPELGLHPFAIAVLAGLMKSAAVRHQLIVSTQSVELVNEFAPDDLIVVDKREGASTFKRPDALSLVPWLEDYSLGEIWKKNLLGGRPTR